MTNVSKSAHGGAILVTLLSTCLSVVLVVGCVGQSPSAKSSPTPQLAPSVVATSLPDPVASSPFDARIVSVFLKDGVTSKQRARLAEQIARIPGVRSFAYISRKLALQRLKKYLAKTDAIDEGNLPLPPSFEIVVKARGDAPSIAKRFVNNPLVANDPGTNDGVGFGDFPTSP